MRNYQLTAGRYRITETFNEYCNWGMGTLDGEILATGTAGESAVFNVPADGEYILYYAAGGGGGWVGFRLEREITQEAEVTNIYDLPAIVPAAVSSELDNHGEERIHVAPYIEPAQEEPKPVDECVYVEYDQWASGGPVLIDFSVPYWVLLEDGAYVVLYAENEKPDVENDWYFGVQYFVENGQVVNAHVLGGSEGYVPDGEWDGWALSVDGEGMEFGAYKQCARINVLAGT